MKALAIAALAAIAAIATPASAQDATAPFTGPKVGVSAGLDSWGKEGFNYGVVAGFDIKALPRVTLGVEAALSDSTTKELGASASRDLSISARAGYVVLPRVLAFGKVGYANTRVGFSGTSLTVNAESVRFGGGLEYALTDHVFVSGEYARTEYEGGVGGRDQALVTVGVRF